MSKTCKWVEKRKYWTHLTSTQFANSWWEPECCEGDFQEDYTANGDFCTHCGKKIEYVDYVDNRQYKDVMAI